MNRRLLFVLIAACLTASCATQHPPDAKALTSDILSAAAVKRACVRGEVPYCLAKGTRINGTSQELGCECAPQGLLTDPRPLR